MTIFQDLSIKTIGHLIVRILIHWIIGYGMNLYRATSKATMIQELKRALKKFNKMFVFESCNSWTNRLYRISQNNGDYLR
jgi:hypothetical protein